MEEKLNKLIDSMEEMQKGLSGLNQINTLKIFKLEYELMIVKNMLFKVISDQKGAQWKEIDSMFESMVHVSIMANYDVIKNALPLLDETFIKGQLGLDD